MWSQVLPEHVGPQNCHGMLSPKLKLHVIPRTDLNQVQDTTINIDEENGPFVACPQTATDYSNRYVYQDNGSRFHLFLRETSQAYKYVLVER